MADIPKTRSIVARHVLKDLRASGVSAEPLLREAGLQMYQISRDPYQRLAKPRREAFRSAP